MDNNQNQNFEQQPVDQAPVDQAPVEQIPEGPVNDGKGKSIAALVLGATGLFFGAILGWWTYFGIVTLVASILGIVFGTQGRKLSKAATGTTNGMATAGLVLSIIGTCVSGIGTVCTVCTCTLVLIGIGAGA